MNGKHSATRLIAFFTRTGTASYNSRYFVFSTTLRVAWWCNGQVVGITIKRSRVQFPAIHFHVTTLDKWFTRMNLVPAKGRWCSVIGKVAVVLRAPSHWTCVTESVVFYVVIYGLNVLRHKPLYIVSSFTVFTSFYVCLVHCVIELFTWLT